MEERKVWALSKSVSIERNIVTYLVVTRRKLDNERNKNESDKRKKHKKKKKKKKWLKKKNWLYFSRNKNS